MTPWPSDWPNAAHSQIIPCAPHRWHVQDAGQGDVALLIHGAGGSLHSFADLIPPLAKTHRTIAIDLPGQGFTQLGARSRCGLTPMTQDIEKLLAHLNATPKLIIAHSAGAAIALELARNITPAPKIIAINAALANFPGLAGVLFPALAKLLTLNPFIPGLFASFSSAPKRVAKLIGSTGSNLSQNQLDRYQQLISKRSHVDATLAMMAQWSLADLLQDLPQMKAETVFLVGEQDKTVPPQTSRDVASRMPNASLITYPNLGHLAHEEDPNLVLNQIAKSGRVAEVRIPTELSEPRKA